MLPFIEYFTYLGLGFFICKMTRMYLSPMFVVKIKWLKHIKHTELHTAINLRTKQTNTRFSLLILFSLFLVIVDELIVSTKYTLIHWTRSLQAHTSLLSSRWGWRMSFSTHPILGHLKWTHHLTRAVTLTSFSSLVKAVQMHRLESWEWFFILAPPPVHLLSPVKFTDIIALASPVFPPFSLPLPRLGHSLSLAGITGSDPH